MAAGLFSIRAMLLLAALVLTALVVSAGTAEDPEFTDTAEDATTARASHDIIRGWATDDNSTITVTLEMTALDAFSPRDDWRTLPSSIYEYYFTVEGKNYAARATVPVHGILAAFASFSLFKVTYGTGGDLNYTSVDESIPGSYTVNWRTAGDDGHVVRGTFEFTVASAVLLPSPRPIAR